MNKIIVFLFLTIGVFLTNSSNAQLGVISKVDAHQITLGDQIRLFITIAQDTSTSKLVWASFPDTFNNLEIVERGKIDTQNNGSVLELKQRLLITGFDSGSFLIPRFQFRRIHFNGSVDSIYSDSFRVLVNTVLVDTSKAFITIKDIEVVKTSWKDNLVLFLALLIGIGLIIWVVLYFIKNKKNKALQKTPQKAETFHEKSLRYLKELDDKQLWQQGKVKEYYTELSEILRQYIELRFNTPAMELTTDDLLRKAKKHKEMTQFRSALKAVLMAADLAKFAKANPMPEEHIEAMEMAANFVKISKPKVEPLVNPSNLKATQK